MLKRFLNGLIAGGGFGVGFLVILVVGLGYVVPAIFDRSVNQPVFSYPKKAELAVPGTVAEARSSRDYSFYKPATARMEIPDGGGVLAMSRLATPDSAQRIFSYQLWLTQTELWHIRTLGEEAEVEMLPYPEGAAVDALDALMAAGVGASPAELTMAIAEEDVLLIKAGKPTPRQSSVHGQFKATVDGVIFVLPDPYAI